MVTGERPILMIAVAASLAAACAGPPADERVGERVLPDTRVIDEHFRHAIAVHGPYRFQTLMPPLAETLAPDTASAPAPAASSFFDRFWPPLTSTPPIPCSSARMRV